MLKKVAVPLVVVIVGLVAVVATRPSTYRVERSLTMAAPAELPFGLVNDFHRWELWSPWEALDPRMKKTFGGAYAGEGATYSWVGNDKVGTGRMSILESKPHESILMRLEFIEPWEDTSSNTFLFEPTAEGVTVRWRMEGHYDFMGKAFSLFMDMEGMIGQDFEKGLASLKGLVEPEARNRAEREALRKAKEAAEVAAEEP
jgi:hypothetical protein